jgi:Uma2 family endonuclease
MCISPAPLTEHQQIAGRIFSDIEQYVRRKQCKVFTAPFDVRLPRKDATSDKLYMVVQPDVCIICDPAKLDRRGCQGAPDTIIEILSQGNMVRDLKEKYSLYEEHGVPEYWIVAPGEQTILVYLLDANGIYQLRGEYAAPGDIPVQSLPEFSLQWEEIFEQIP